MRQNQISETAILEAYHTYFDGYLEGNIDRIASVLDENFVQVGSAETEVFFNKTDALKFMYDTIDQVAGNLQVRNRDLRIEYYEKLALVSELCDLFALADGEWVFYAKFRVSTLLQEKAGEWKIVQQHSSFPDARTAEGDNIGIEKLIDENLQLREAVKKRTAELEQKNGELQIEAALERVRAKAMAMRKSEDLQSAVATVFEEFTKLSLDILRCGVGILNTDSRTGTSWTTSASDDSTVQISGYESFDMHPLMSGVYDSWKKQEDFSYELAGKDLMDFYKAMDTSELKLPRSQVVFSEEQLKTQYYYGAMFDAGHLYAFANRPFSAADINIMKRFAGVLGLTYQRFRDIQKAEALAVQAENDLIQLKVEKKRTEEALIELQLTQKQLVQSEKMASLGELTAGIAHEIQNPLNFINNFSDVNVELLTEMQEALAKENKEELKAVMQDIQSNLEKIHHHGKRADAIVKNMLQHSRKTSAQKERADINALADEYLRLSYHGLRAKDSSFNASIHTSFDDAVGMVPVIPQDLGRVLLNLFNNAFYAVNEKKRELGEGFEASVSVQTLRKGNQLEILIRDNGNGIPGHVKEKIFQPFFTTKPTGEGTGLGLSLSYDIITKGHGGVLKVESEEGKGSVFVISMPADKM
jgi:signal transduction histidine kinase/ketosteroid isomerase-like protein